MRILPLFLLMPSIALLACGRLPPSTSKVQDDSTTPFKTFSVRGVLSQSGGCAAEAEEIAARFKQVTGVTPYNTDCTEKPEGSDVTITYMAPDRLPLVSAVYGLFGGEISDLPFPSMDLPLWGSYPSLSGCVAAVPLLTADFEAETGLTAVASSCYHASIDGYVLRIDSFGSEPAKRFHNLPVEFQGKVDQSFADKVADLFERQGASVRSAIPWGGYVVVMFYAPVPVSVAAKTIGLFGQVESLEACRVELTATVKALEEIMGQVPALATCTPDSSDATAHINFAFTTQSRLPAYWQETGPLYSTHERCASDREHLVETFRQSSGRNVKGAICVMESSFLPSKYKAMLIGGG